MNCVECSHPLDKGVICARCQNYLDNHDDLVKESEEWEE